MSHTYCMAFLTAPKLSPPEAATVAAKTGYDWVGLRLQAPPGGYGPPILDEPAIVRETAKRCKDNGISVYDVDIVRLDPDFSVAKYAKFLDVCGALGAKAVLVAGDDPDELRMIQNYAAFCEAARPFGLTADLEFMPWTRASSVSIAHRIVAAANQPNGGVLVDALHFARSASTLADLEALPRHMLHYAQICDGPAEVPTTLEGLLHTARVERMLAGEGGIDLTSIFTRLPENILICVEIPSLSRTATMGAEAWARLCLDTSKKFMDGLRAGDSHRTGKSPSITR